MWRGVSSSCACDGALGAQFDRGLLTAALHDPRCPLSWNHYCPLDLGAEMVHWQQCGVLFHMRAQHTRFGHERTGCGATCPRALSHCASYRGGYDSVDHACAHAWWQ